MFSIDRIPWDLVERDTLKFRASASRDDAIFTLWDSFGNWAQFTVPRPRIPPNGLRVGFLWDGGTISLHFDGQAADVQKVVPKA